MRAAVTMAARHWSVQPDPILSSEALRKYIKNAPIHIFGSHEKCCPYFCTGPKEGEANLVNDLKSCGMWLKLEQAFAYLAQHATSLLQRMSSNLAENFNGVLAKFTASHFGEVCKRRASTKCCKLVERFLYKPTFHNKATEYGQLSEAKAIEELEKKGIRVKKSGFFVDEEYLFLGASPDGLIEDDGVLEVKSPYSVRSLPAEEALAKLPYVNNKMELKQNSNYYYQDKMSHVFWWARIQKVQKKRRPPRHHGCDFRELEGESNKIVHFFYETNSWITQKLISDKSPRGVLIVLEGCDRSGKSTQCQMLADRLQKEGIPAQLLRFPDRSSTTGKLIDEYLKQKTDLPDEAVHLLFTANRWELEPKMRKLLLGGTTLIVDRYSYSGIVYSAAKKSDISSLEWYKSPEAGLPKPDTVLYLNLSDEVIRMRKGFGGERYEHSEFQKKVAYWYENLKDDTWKIIDADRSIEELHDILYGIVRYVRRSYESTPLQNLW